MSELYTGDKKSKYSSNPNDILKSAKNFDEKLYAELFSKISNRKKISNKQFHHFETSIFLEKVAKSINSQTNFKSYVLKVMIA